MNRKRQFDSWFRGWLPKDQPFQNGAFEISPKTNQNAKNSETENSFMTKGQIRASVAIGVSSMVMFSVYAIYIVYYLITPGIQSTWLGFSLLVFLSATWVSVNYLLYRNYKKQTRLAEGV